MRVGVMGAGAVGCYFGGMLARAGHDVVLIGRANHVDAIEAQGLRLQTLGFDEYVRVHASTDPADLGNCDCVLVCVKSADTEQAGTLIRPHIRTDTQVLSLQNGVDNAQRLAVSLQTPVIASVVYVGTEMAGPGHVRHHGRGELVIGDGPTSQTCASWLTEAAIPTTVTPNIEGALWTKFIINCVYNALSAITQMPYGNLVQSPGIWTTMKQAFDECNQVAQAKGIRFDQPVWPMVETIARTMQGQMSSTAQDLRMGKATEIDHLNGTLVKMGESVGIATPTHQALWSLVKALESKANGTR